MNFGTKKKKNSLDSISEHWRIKSTRERERERKKQRERVRERVHVRARESERESERERAHVRARERERERVSESERESLYSFMKHDALNPQLFVKIRLHKKYKKK